MTYALVTIAAPLKREDVAGVRALIETTLGNPAEADVKAAIEGEAGTALVHFMSLHALLSGDGKHGHLVFEFSADGEEGAAVAVLATRLDALFTPIFARCIDWRANDTLRGYWTRHQVRIGFGLFDAPGIAHAGTPGMTVERIRAENRLAHRSAKLLKDAPSDAGPLARVDHVRAGLATDPQWAWALTPPPAPLQGPTETPTTSTILGALIPSFFTTFLWPVGIVLLIGAVLSAVYAHDFWPRIGAALQFLWMAIWPTVLIVALFVGYIYVRLRRAEVRDWLDTRSIGADALGGILARENLPGIAQNHMISATVLKPGFVRRVTIRVAFWAVATISALNPKQGYLGDIGTIHFARWVTIPGSRDFLFMSNYGGSWESYLEDFITRAHAGLTGIWSNTVGFPRTENLFLKGATDGERFKRFARASMVHTPFWFTAYPEVTTDNIRSNAAIRRGIGAVMSDEEAIDWLAMFGSAVRPADKIESSEVQSIVFGGLGFKPFGMCLALRFGDDRAQTRAWLADMLPYVAFNDGRRLKCDPVVTLALSAGGLARLGLPQSALDTFPAAFLQGMTAPGRDRILGDVGANAAEQWWWGAEPADATLLVYGVSDKAVRDGAKDFIKRAKAAGHSLVKQIDLTEVSPHAGDRKEPFGFVDGTSQPVIRGTYRGLRNGDPIHLVEAGEFILGYPDNRGNMPPGPHMAATLDPQQCLPIASACSDFGENSADADRDIGRNGSFLVLRHLEQDADEFWRYCKSEAQRLSGVLPAPYEITEEFIAAKMMGRWKDGSSIARFPYISASAIKARKAPGADKPMARPASNPMAQTLTAIAPATIASASAPASNGPNNTIVADNDFLFGAEDPEGLRCPFGAHIRRANPRDSLVPGSQEQVDISNRHRIMRIGRGCRADKKRGEKNGLLFMALNGDIERQFEFVQQTWLGSPKFLTLDAEVDPIVVEATPGTNNFTIPTRGGPLALSPLPRFVTMRGGGYFFLPSRRLLTYLCA
jgi:deferrochelatase/peroxidase EfeB